MPAQTAPPVITTKPQGGVLPISAVTDKSNSHTGAASRHGPVNNVLQRLKVVLRRLPPGLTENELYTTLGEDWRPGKGKITWASFRKGKVSKDLAKASRPARVYLYVADRAQLDALSQRVAHASFADARSSTNDSALIGPPSLEFAPYGRIPNNKLRHDVRQGTIDQDPEFIEFLESLTNPITKPKALDAADTQKQDAVTVTPLIQHLRDKKAAREKAASNKAAARQLKQDTKPEATNGVNENKPATSAKEAQAEKKPNLTAKAGEKASKDAVRSPPRKDRSAPSTRSQNVSAATPSATPAKTDSPTKRPTGPSPGSAAARMIQRDLGIRGGRGSSARPGREERRSPVIQQATPVGPPDGKQAKNSGSATLAPKPIPAVAASVANAQQKPLQSVPAQTNTTRAPSQPQQQTKPPTGPKATTTTPVKPAKAATVDPTATRAFLRHANPSQGITETLLESALAPLGKTVRVEIDKRKGFAYIDFAAPSGLQAAIAASPIAVAQGSVQVLERKDRGAPTITPTAPAMANQGMPMRGGRGGIGAGYRGSVRGGRGRGGAFGGRGEPSSVPVGGAGTNGSAMAPVAPKPTPTPTPGNANKAEAP